MERFFGGGIEPLGEREVGLRAATDARGRDGHIVEPTGIDLTNFKRNPVILWSHDPLAPIGTATAIGINAGDLVARVAFAPAGASPIADQVCALTKSGVVNACSIGFDPIEYTPLDKSRPRGGQHITRSELLEISLVAIGADTGAMVIERAAPGSRTAFRSLPMIPSTYVQRALATVRRNPRAALFSYAGTVWAIGEQRRIERERFATREARQRRVDELRRLCAG